jgi:hypothetical protein
LLTGIVGAGAFEELEVELLQGWTSAKTIKTTYKQPFFGFASSLS